MTAQIVPLRPAYGATPEEWTWAELVIGAADLLPVVSNPNAVISEGSTLKALGKTPSIYNRSGRVAGIPKWNNPQEPVTAAKIERWRREPDYGLCIRTGEIVALDLDDADQAGAMAALVAEHLGVLPVRSRPNSGRRIIAFRVAGGLSKRSFETASGLVEQLGRGQHFVACGTHVSGVRYTWEGGLPSDLPVVSREALDACWAALEARFAVKPTVSAGAANDRSRPDLEGVEDDVVDYLDQRGLILGRGDGKVFVECPWKDQHSSDNGVSETAWLVAGGSGYERGHFKCQHTSHGQKTRAEFLDAIRYRASGFMPLADPAHTSPGLFSAADLELRTFEPLAWVVPNYLPQGLSVLAGRPKLGKSWLALNWALAIAAGGKALGEQCEQGDVLYAALEDNQRRLKSRMEKLAPNGGWPKRLSFACQLPSAPGKAVMAVRDWLQQADNPRAVVIDVFSKVRPPKLREEGNYEADYRAVSEWKVLADEFDIAVILVHHVRKMGADDPLEMVSGTNGLTGAADAILILNRTGSGVTLGGRGRDLEEFDKAIEFDKERCLWVALGDAAVVHRSDQRSTILNLLAGAGAAGLSPSEIASLSDLNANATKQLLFKMKKSGEVDVISRGRYVHPAATAFDNLDNP